MDPKLNKRRAAFRDMGGSFLLHSRNEMLSIAERSDYAFDAAYMYAMSVVEKAEGAGDQAQIEVIVSASQILGLPSAVVGAALERLRGQQRDSEFLRELLGLVEHFRNAVH